MNKEERAERLTRRIESFSDLVIGFSLALLALTLSIPANIHELFRSPWWIVAYFWTFIAISTIWYNHQRLFTHYFWPEPLTIILNFALLSMMGLLVYFVQVFVHFHTAYDHVWAFLAYFAVFGVALVLLGTLYLHGTWRRWIQLDAKERYTGVNHTARGILTGGAILIGVVVCASRPARSMDDVWPLMISVLVAVIGVRVTQFILKQRVAGFQTVR